MVIRSVGVVALFLIGCSSKPAPERAEPEEEWVASCDQMADRAATLLQQDAEVEADRAGEIRDAVLRLCNEDPWPNTARSCVMDANDHRALEDCAHQYLSDEQYRNVSNEIERILDDSDDGAIGMPPE